MGGELLCKDAVLSEAFHLVLDKGEEGGEDDGHAWKEGGREGGVDG